MCDSLLAVRTGYLEGAAHSVLHCHHRHRGHRMGHLDVRIPHRRGGDRSCDAHRFHHRRPYERAQVRRHGPDVITRQPAAVQRHYVCVYVRVYLHVHVYVSYVCVCRRVCMPLLPCMMDVRWTWLALCVCCLYRACVHLLFALTLTPSTSLSWFIPPTSHTPDPTSAPVCPTCVTRFPPTSPPRTRRRRSTSCPPPPAARGLCSSLGPPHVINGETELCGA
jgi:hypothetical protein